jgi:methyl-accepting chemotaxis protein WspA
MTPFRNLRLAARLLLLVSAFIVVFFAFAFVSWRTLEAVRVNGPVYNEIAEGKDLIADTLPPPAYIIEAQLITLQLADETETAQIAPLVERGNALRLEFENRHEFWKRTLPPGALADAMNVTAFRPAIEYFDLRDKELIPALRSHDAARVKSAIAALKLKYEAHRRAVDEVVKMARDRNARLELSAEDAVHAGQRSLIALGALVVGVVLLIAWVTGRMAAQLSSRIELAARAATQVAAGDLGVKVPETQGEDESARLLSAIQGMTASLNSLVMRVKQASIELMSTATEFTATGHQQEAGISALSASTNQIAATTREISATSAELLATMEGVNAVAGQTAQVAEGGRASLAGMDDAMRRLEQATASISARLATIHEKAADISSVVTTITKVADQTNLLSVNAAIEAEKAGEQGLGFLVLAREIRRLADQTAVATLDIEQMVRHMQGAVTAGVMEMDGFAAEVKRGVASTAQVGSQLGQIIGQVQTLSERFDSVNHGMRSQSQGARQISDAMAQLKDGARTSAASLKEFNAANAHLRDAVSSLREEISHFKVS